MHENITSWTCDTCGRQERMATTKPPKGWRRVVGALLEDPEVEADWELCQGCYGELERLLQPKRDRVADLQRTAA